MKALLRQPFLHFVMLSLLIFWYVGNDADVQNDLEIVVDEAAVLEFLQFREQRFDESAARDYLNSLDDEALDAIIHQVVREEALYREAQALGLDQHDYMIRRRMIQKAEFLATGVDEPEALPEAAIKAFYEANQDLYRREPQLSFAHIFFRAAPEAEARAKTLQQQLAADGQEPDELGDPFNYNRVYTQRRYGVVVSHFGPEFASGLIALAPGAEWQGPIASTHGWHLVRVDRIDEGGTPPLAEVHARVEADALRQRRRERIAANVAAVLDKYSVVRDPALQERASN